jgi:hypothetical protein
MLERARIPKRYEHCSLDSYESAFRGVNKTLAAAHMRARKFVEGYPIESGGTGLLLTGSIGVGKTHLAVGILQAVIAERGASGLFWDYRELLKEVQNSYNQGVHPAYATPWLESAPHNRDACRSLPMHTAGAPLNGPARVTGIPFRAPSAASAHPKQLSIPILLPR